jgi:hypothetical protein
VRINFLNSKFSNYFNIFFHRLIVSNPNNTTNQAANDTSSNSTSNENNQILIESVYKECPFHFIRTEW